MKKGLTYLSADAFKNQAKPLLTLVGKVKRVGETVGNEKLANQGVVDQAKGAARETWGNAKDAANEVQRSHKDAATDKAHETRDKLRQSVQNAKEKVNEKIDEFKKRHSA